MTFDAFIFVLEIIGTVAFAISGVMVAKERKMDIFGATLLGCTTAVGGGAIRDILLGITPPSMFVHPVYILVAFVTCTVDFIIEKHVSGSSVFSLESGHIRTAYMLSAADSVGLAAFAVVGCRTAMNAGFADNHFLVIFVGTVTGIGGGILRDMMAGRAPLIFTKRIYGLAAIAGAFVFTAGTALTGALVPFALFGMGVTILIRFLAIRHHWNLPSFR